MALDIKSVSLENDPSDDFDRWLETKGLNEYNRFISEVEHIVKDRYNVSTFMNSRLSSDGEQFDNVISKGIDSGKAIVSDG